MAEKPKIPTDNDMYQLLRSHEIDEFNEKRSSGHECMLMDCDFRSLDLRGMNAEGLDLSGAYFRNTDLRGIDFRKTNLEGATFANAKISGGYFSTNIPAAELQLSVEHGTRIRIKDD